MIFERLYQEANSTDSSREGLGLGLYICASAEAFFQKPASNEELLRAI